jgi:UDP-N-acetylmuramyl pentapeptide phosphotransferase/UDP-N-acetylglucosamine-1-phosphate transferase
VAVEFGFIGIDQDVQDCKLKLFEQLLQLGGLTAAASLVMSLLIVLSQKWHGSFSHDHDLQGVQKVHTTVVPRIGGLAVMIGVIVGMCLVPYFAADMLSDFDMRRIGMLLLVSIPAFGAGLVEDVTKRVSVRVRLCATMASAVLASFVLGATVDELDIWGIDALLLVTPLAMAVTAIVVAGAANAINIIDGFNGLSTSALMVMGAGLCAIAWQHDDIFVIVLGVLCIGTTLGFFLVNYPCGKLFLGDGGAYFLGFWVAEMAVLLVRHTDINAWQVLSVCAYPIIEVMFSIYRRKFIRRVSPGAPDGLHLHTLVYRRVVYFIMRRDCNRAWKRNAAVPCIIIPAVSLFVMLGVIFGQNIPAAIAVVLLQLASYILVYRRLIYGRWNAPGSLKSSAFGMGGAARIAEKQS